MESLTLYTNPRSRGRIARWMLEETGLPYEAVVLEYGPTMKAPDYLAINPMGKVPALTHGARVVTECAAICAYLADAFPETGLMPDDRASFYRWMFFGAGPFEAATVDGALGVTVPPEKRGMVGYGSMEDVVRVLDAQLTTHPYLCGAAFSAVDVYVGSQIAWGMGFKTVPETPAFAAYAARIMARPAALAAKAKDDALLQARP